MHIRSATATATATQSRRHLVNGTVRPSTRVESLTTRPAFGGTAVRPTDGPILFVSLVLGAAVALLVALTLMNGSVSDLNLPFGGTPGLDRVLDHGAAVADPATEPEAPAPADPAAPAAAAEAPASDEHAPAPAVEAPSHVDEVPAAVPAASLKEAF